MSHALDPHDHSNPRAATQTATRTLSQHLPDLSHEVSLCTREKSEAMSYYSTRGHPFDGLRQDELFRVVLQLMVDSLPAHPVSLHHLHCFLSQVEIRYFWWLVRVVHAERAGEAQLWHVSM